MSNVSGLGLSSERWETMVQEQTNCTKAKLQGHVSNESSKSNVSSTENQEKILNDDEGILSFLENRCTDDKDDGKIGFWAAAGNLIQGVGKGLVNGIVGCFTNKEGKFSLGKTLFSLGAAAVCIAFPAVGLVACGIGAVLGGAKVIGGIKNVFSAQNDAQAKQAWENIGEGGFTVASSVLGAKASYKAIGKTSTAAVDDVVKNVTKAIDKADDAAGYTSALKEAGIEGSKQTELINILKSKNQIKELSNKEISAITRDFVTQNGNFKSQTALGNLDKLDDASTIGEKVTQVGKFAKALGKDTISSTKNNYGVAKNQLNAIKQSAAASKDASTIRANETTIKKNNNSLKNKDLTREQRTELIERNKSLEESNLKIREQYQQNNSETLLDSRIESQQIKADTKNQLKQNVKNAKEDIKTSKEVLKEVKKTKNEANIEKANKGVQNSKDALKAAQKEQMDNTTIGQLKQKVRNTNTGQYIKEHMSQKSSNATTQKGIKGLENSYNSLKSNLRNFKENGFNIDFQGFLNALTDDGKAVVQFLTQTDGSYAQAVQQFGYDNVLEVLKIYNAYNLFEKAA